MIYQYVNERVRKQRGKKTKQTEPNQITRRRRARAHEKERERGETVSE